MSNHEVPIYKLTERHEQIIARMGHILNNVPENMLYELITDDNERPYPERWI